MSKKLSHQEQTFQTQLGQSATVQRETVKGDHVERANFKLRALGEEMNPVPQNLEYKGSAALHVFYNTTLKQMFVITQTATLQGCPELVALAAVKDMNGAIMELFGHRRPKMRSNF